jgi:hypothetical protein
MQSSPDHTVGAIKREIEAFVDKHVYAPTPEEEARGVRSGK